jgi:hypothetical protein
MSVLFEHPIDVLLGIAPGDPFAIALEDIEEGQVLELRYDFRNASTGTLYEPGTDRVVAYGIHGCKAEGGES